MVGATRVLQRVVIERRASIERVAAEGSFGSEAPHSCIDLEAGQFGSCKGHSSHYGLRGRPSL